MWNWLVVFIAGTRWFKRYRYVLLLSTTQSVEIITNLEKNIYYICFLHHQKMEAWHSKFLKKRRDNWSSNQTLMSDDPKLNKKQRCVFVCFCQVFLVCAYRTDNVLGTKKVCIWTFFVSCYWPWIRVTCSAFFRICVRFRWRCVNSNCCHQTQMCDDNQ